MDQAEYQVWAYGQIQQVMPDDEDDAVNEAKNYPDHADARVVLHVTSGTYESHTCVWPERGETYSN